MCVFLYIYTIKVEEKLFQDNCITSSPIPISIISPPNVVQVNIKHNTSLCSFFTMPYRYYQVPATLD